MNYCPRLRDGITRRTLFIAPDLAAVTASSVGDDARGAINQFVTEPAALAALTGEFARYAGICLPLMRILTGAETDTARQLLMELMAQPGDAFIAQAAPSLIGMPEARDAFHKNLETARVYELIPQHFEERAHAARLIGMAEALERYENYHVVLLRTPFLPANMALYHKMRAGTILARTDDYKIAFAINEPTLIAAFGETLMRQVAGADKAGYRTQVIKRLREAAERLNRVDNE